MATVRNNRAPVNDSGGQVASPTDLREQLYNAGQTGLITDVQLSEAEVTSLRGVLLDLDPDKLRKAVVPEPIRNAPKAFYDRVASPWLGRQPVLSKAEVRNSGTGLHVILRFDKPLEFEAEGDRRRWSAVVRAVQKLLPTDPDCPGITALTRPIGSINGKNGRKVSRLRKGEAVTAREVLDLFEQVQAGPFRVVARILLGSDRVTPCPVCNGEGSRLDVLDHVGKCYGGCGKVRLGQLFDVFLKPRKREG